MTTVDTYVERYDPDTDFDRWYTVATAEAIGRWLGPGQRILELGCATGLMTSMLAGQGRRIWAVDRFAAYLDRARARELPGVEWIEGDVYDDHGTGTVDHVVATDLLHELPDPARFLDRCAAALAPGGLLHLAVPNPDSLHRLVAVEMGLIEDAAVLSETSAALGHVGHLTRGAVLDLLADAGFRPERQEGVMLKPLPNADLARLPDEVIRGLIGAARHLPEHGAFTLVTARHG